MFPKEKDVFFTADDTPIPAHGGAFRPHWTREQVYRMYEDGVLDPQKRYELIAGEIYQKMPMKAPHAVSVELVGEALRGVFRQFAAVRTEKSLVLATDGQPQPDAAVVRGTTRTYETAHPTQDDTLLVVEVSDTTLGFDRGRKGAYYAEAGIAEYWIVNIAERQVEVCRNPHADPEAEGGFAYDAPVIARIGDTVSPLAAPNADLAVADLLPGAEETGVK